jgi:alpha-ketoglutarate-dependent taurine dioxygenase
MSVAVEPPDTDAIGSELRFKTSDELGSTEGRAHLGECLHRNVVVRVVCDEPIDPAAITAVARDLGDPPSYSSAGVRFVPGHDILGDFSAPAKADDGRSRTPGPAESLHQDFGTLVRGFSSHSVLHTRDVPPIQPMHWVHAGAAYASLPPDLQRRICALRAIHANGPDPTDGPRRPLVLAHPQTGEPALHLPIRRDAAIENVDGAEGDRIITTLWQAIESSPARYERVLESGDLYVWDNVASFHDNPAFPRDKERAIWFLTIPCAANPTAYAHG